MALARCLKSGLSAEQLRDDVLKGDVFDGDVGDGAGAKDFLADGDDVFAGDAEGEFPVVSALGCAVAGLPGIGK